MTISDNLFFEYLNEQVQMGAVKIDFLLKENKSEVPDLYVKISAGHWSIGFNEIAKLMLLAQEERKEQERLEREQQEEYQRRNQEKKAMKQRFVYLMRNNVNGRHKIGKSIDPNYREKTLQSQEPDVTLLFFCSEDIVSEKYLQEMFAEKRVRGEWFDLDANDILEIKNLMQA